MKIEAVRNFVAGSACALLIGLSANSNAELIYGVSDQLNSLISFDSVTPQNIIHAYNINGLQSGEQIRGIDFVGSTLYALGSASHLYTLNTANGQASLVGSFTPILNGFDFGFNSVGSQFYLVSDLGQSMTLSPALATSTFPSYPSSAAIDGMAYDHGSGFYYGISASTHDWYTLNPALGIAINSGTIGTLFGDRVGLDISPNTGTAYFAATVNNQTLFYTVNKSNGALTQINTVGPPGQLSSGLDGIAVAPEPNAVALFAVGGLLVALVLRKK